MQASRDAAFQRGMMEGVARAEGELAARERATEAKIREEEIGWQKDLKDAWMRIGASAAEAEAAARLFKIDDNLPVILENIKRKGAQAGISEAKAAYAAHEYKLADQLAVAAAIAHRDQPAEPTVKVDEKKQAEAETEWKKKIAKEWIALGMDAKKAESVANMFKLDLDALVPIVQRVEREGWKLGAEEFKAARLANDYQLANQLLFAVDMAYSERPEDNPKPDDKPMLKQPNDPR